MPWDSDALGLEVHEIRCSGDAAAVSGALPGLLEQLGSDLVFCRLAIGEVELARALGARGFYAVESSFELTLPLARRSAAPPVRFPRGVALRAAAEGDLDAIAAIAREAFSTDRYHLEPAVPAGRASARMEGWVRRAFADRDPVFVLADDRGRTLGFFHVRPGAEEAVDLSLAAVAPALRGSGLGPLLYAAVLDECRDRGFRSAHTRIAAQNLEVLNLYAHLGFAFLRSLLCFHRPAG